jgi:NAD(P)-dependent dehydrogenase (short-subunit alcohol dehydrogenase family)
MTYDQRHRVGFATVDLQLTGKTALITGSGKGIGEAIARTLAREGAIVIVHGRDEARTQWVAHDIVAKGGRAHGVIGDLTQDDAVGRLIREAEDLVGPIAILVNNAGGSGGTREDWKTAQPASWASAFDRNVLAALRVATHPLPGMRDAK